jgi:hypothetical protein
MFSKDSNAFPFVRVIFNTFGGADGSVPIIPRFFQRAIVDFVEERYYNAMKNRSPRTYGSIWRDAKNGLESYTGNWRKAIKRASSMDTAEKEWTPQRRSQWKSILVQCIISNHGKSTKESSYELQ